jgi:hypothetical protein
MGTLGTGVVAYPAGNELLMSPPAFADCDAGDRTEAWDAGLGWGLCPVNATSKASIRARTTSALDGLAAGSFAKHLEMSLVTAAGTAGSGGNTGCCETIAANRLARLSAWNGGRPTTIS